MHILITGSAGFIGYFLTRELVKEGHRIYGIDSVNDYYDVRLKQARLADCGITGYTYGREEHSRLFPGYRFRQLDLCDTEALSKLFHENRFDCVVNLAAQAGVRYSLENPGTYIDSNVRGFLNLLEECRLQECPRFVYASSSSVYGNGTPAPFREDSRTDAPASIYAATKKSDELLAWTYSHLYGLRTVGLRFFTVYGPYGRPDMAPMLFAEAILEGRPIQVFNNGRMERDFTYITDITEGISRIVTQPGITRDDLPGVPATIYNIGHGSPLRLTDFIDLLEKHLGCKAIREMAGMQPGDVFRTWADTTRLHEDYGYRPETNADKGIGEFAAWYKIYHSRKT